MPGIQQYFKRYEVKYLLSDMQYQEFRDRTGIYLAEDMYGETDICNCYFDTENYRLIRNSLEKGIYKEKLRLRSYGIPDNDEAKVYLELKKKYDGIVYKRREGLTFGQSKQVMDNISPHTFSELSLDSQIFREISWIVRYYETLSPAMFLSYRRIAMYEPDGNLSQTSTGNTGLRVTFDCDIAWRTEDVDLQHGIYGNTLLDTGQRIMEIKAPGAIPMWLVKILNEMKLYPTSYSKYGRAYEQMVRRSGQISC